MIVLEWIRFLIGFAFLLGGLIIFTIELIGVFRFRYVLNRMHAAVRLATLGLFFSVMGLIVAKGFTLEDGSFDITSIKLACIVLFLWLTSPVSSHVISKLIYMTDSNTDKETVEIDVNEQGGIENHD